MINPKIEESIRPKIEGLLKKGVTTLASTIGIEYTVISKDLVAATMPVDSRTKQPFGLLHGGASVALAESLASIGGWLNVDENNFAVVGMEINANHIRAVRDGSVTGEARPLHRGKSSQVWEIQIRTSDGKLICTSRCTLAVVPINR